MRILNAILGLLVMPFKVRIFRPERIFKGKRVAIIGAADSAFDTENGAYIDGFDYVVRVNKSLITWNKENEKYLGTKCDVLIHNFHENMDTGGGGPIDWEVFKKFGVRYLIQTRNDKAGLRLMFNYFKKYLNQRDFIYVLPRNYYNGIIALFEKYHPTRGFYALYSALTSNCEEVFITGFTFFKTPYAYGYRDNIRELSANKEHIKSQGYHSIEMEYANFLKVLEKSNVGSIIVDDKLHEIIKEDSTSLVSKLKKRPE
ncbi:glycosyltransferase family 29 protein [Roseivirga pacifica]|uniref:glycosyltransferase family 29 protein n=1 Tax=Roseivirga pacifica TaxID=1267423 RepID=UPI003BB2103F